MTAFNKGDRIKLSPEGLRCISGKGRERGGTIVGFCRDYDCYRVKWDGIKTVDAYHKKFLERVEKCIYDTDGDGDCQRCHDKGGCKNVGGPFSEIIKA